MFKWLHKNLFFYVKKFKALDNVFFCLALNGAINANEKKKKSIISEDQKK